MSESDTEDLDVLLRPVPLPGQDASVVDLRQAVKMLQLQNVELLNKLKEVTAANAVVSAQNGKKKGRKSNGMDDDVLLLGKKFAITVSIWAPTNMFEKPRPILLPDIARFANEETKKAFFLDELYDFVPPKYHESLEGLPDFGDKFRTGMSNIRSTVIYNIRSRAAGIFQLENKYFRGDHSLKACDEIYRLIGYDAASKTYSTWPPILFPNCIIDKSKPFRNDSLRQILMVALNGSGSLTSTSKAKPKTNGQLWGMTSVTDGAIAFAAITARFILSTDKEFVSTGGTTKIDYNKDFWTYRKVLHNIGEEAHQELIDWFNSAIFSSNKASSDDIELDGIADADDDDDDISELINAVNLGAGAGASTSVASLNRIDEEPDTVAPPPLGDDGIDRRSPSRPPINIDSDDTSEPEEPTERPPKKGGGTSKAVKSVTPSATLTNKTASKKVAKKGTTQEEEDGGTAKTRNRRR